MPAELKCPQCGQPLIVKEAMLGKKARCPKCKAVIQMPAAEQPAAETPGAPGKCCSCGRPLEPGAVFCVGCGTDQRTGESVDIGGQPEATTSEERDEQPPSSAPAADEISVPKPLRVAGPAAARAGYQCKKLSVFGRWHCRQSGV